MNGHLWITNDCVHVTTLVEWRDLQGLAQVGVPLVRHQNERELFGNPPRTLSLNRLESRATVLRERGRPEVSIVRLTWRRSFEDYRFAAVDFGELCWRLALPVGIVAVPPCEPIPSHWEVFLSEHLRALVRTGQS